MIYKNPFFIGHSKIVNFYVLIVNVMNNENRLTIRLEINFGSKITYLKETCNKLFRFEIHSQLLYFARTFISLAKNYLLYTKRASLALGSKKIRFSCRKSNRNKKFQLCFDFQMSTARSLAVVSPTVANSHTRLLFRLIKEPASAEVPSLPKISS